MCVCVRVCLGVCVSLSLCVCVCVCVRVCSKRELGCGSIACWLNTTSMEEAISMPSDSDSRSWSLFIDNSDSDTCASSELARAVPGDEPVDFGVPDHPDFSDLDWSSDSADGERAVFRKCCRRNCCQPFRRG